MIENPPMTAFVSGTGPLRDCPVDAHYGRLLPLDAATEDPDPASFGLLDHHVRGLADRSQSSSGM
jgi:hypothetical protein